MAIACLQTKRLEENQVVPSCVPTGEVLSTDSRAACAMESGEQIWSLHFDSISSVEQNKYQHYRDTQLIKCVLYKPEDPGIQIKPGDRRASPYYPGMAVQIDQPPGFPWPVRLAENCL